jgi:hypothetical protein
MVSTTTNLTLQDSGYRQVPTTGAETVKANSGDAFTLKGVSLKLNMTTLLNDEPTKQYVSDTDTNEYTFGEVDKNGLNMPVWDVEGILDMTDATDRNVLAYLIECVETKGFKKLATTNDADSTIFLRWSDITPVTSINVRIKSFGVTQKAASKMASYKLQLVETS